MELSPGWIAGFVDGEGCFYVGVYKHPEMTAGWQVLPEFRVVQHLKDIKVLYGIKHFLGCGVVRKNHETRYELRIRKLNCLRSIIEFFRKHPLKTSKRYDFEKFADILILMERGEHLKKTGLKKIIDIATKMNTASHPRLEKIAADL